mgnify:CR=1 FL=1
MLNTLETSSGVAVGRQGLRLLISGRDAGVLARLKALAVMAWLLRIAWNVSLASCSSWPARSRV